MVRRPFRKQTPEHNITTLKTKQGRRFRANYQRIIIKISGEMLGGKEIFSFKTFRRLADELKSLNRSGLKIGVVVGGGNICRGRDLKAVARINADWMGMTATLINGLVLKYFLEKNKIKSHLFSGVEVESLAERFSFDRARALYENQTILIFVFGTGHPAFTTDTAAALRAVELGAEAILKGTKVAGIYDRDPMKDKKAKFYRRLSYQEAISKRLGVMDGAAFSLCAEYKIKIHVFNFYKHSLPAVVKNYRLGTIIA